MPEDVRRLAAIMLTDIAGYTAMTQADERLTLELLSEHALLLRDRFAEHQGREVKGTGDGFLVEFPSALEAVRCAIEIQEALHDRNASVPKERALNLRIGIHVGDVVHRGEDVFGDGVNITSRIEPLAEPGGISISRQVYDQVWNKLDLPLVSLGEQALKNVKAPIEVFRVVFPWEGEAACPAPEVDRLRIAVLPLVNISPDPADEYFADGMTEELIYSLSKVCCFRVIAQTSVIPYRGVKKPASVIGRELRVGALLEGSVRKAGNRVRITLQLIDVASEEHLWSEAYDRSLEDLFAVQSDVAQRVAEALQVRLVPTEKERLDTPATEDLNAYMLYIRGRHFWNMRTEDGVRRAIELFQAAIALDPNYALAYSGIADSYSILADRRFVPPVEVLPKAKEAADKALSLDPGLAEAHASLGLVRQESGRDPAGAEEELRRAIAINPSYAMARHWYAILLLRQGRDDEAFAQSQRAAELDPFSPVIVWLAADLLRASGEPGKGLALLRGALEKAPDVAYTRLNLANAMENEGDWQGAEEEIRMAIQGEPGNAGAHSNYGYHLVFRGRVEEGLREIDKALALEPQSAMTAVKAAVAYYLARHEERAVELLRWAAERDPTDPAACGYLGYVLATSRPEEALPVLEKAERLDSGSSADELAVWVAAGQGLAYASQGNAARAQEKIDLLGKAPRVSGGSYHAAVVSAALARTDAAFQWLEKAFAERNPMLRVLGADPRLDCLRSDPRFPALLERIGLAGEQVRSRPK